MNILFLLHSFSIGGAERRCTAVANYFASQGDHVIAVLLDAPTILFDLDKRIQVFYLPGENSAANKEPLRGDKRSYTEEQFHGLLQSYSTRIFDLIKQYPDYIVASWVSLYSVATAMALQSLPNKFVFVECNAPDAEFDKNHYFNTLKQTYYPRANGAIFQTEDEKSFYTFLNSTQKYVIPNPVADLHIPRYEGVRKKTVVTYCRLRKAKRLPLLIDAFGLFREHFPDYTLEIYGEGNDKQTLIEYIEQKGLGHCVQLFDFDIHIHTKIYDCAMFVSASLFEGMSNSMLEAMSIGLPVVCTDCYGGGARAIIEDGENGLLVPVEDPVALAEGMKRIAGNKDLSDKLSRNAVLIKNRLTTELICKSWHTAFEEIASI